VKKILVVLAVLAFASLASAQTFSFWNAAGSFEYCNFAVLNYPTSGVVAGYDNLVTGCFYSVNSPIVGFIATTPLSSLPAHGKGQVYGDGLYDAASLTYTGLQWTVWQSAKVSKKRHGFFTGPWGWLGVAGTYTGYYFGDNYGYLGAGYPGPKAASHGTTAGAPKNLLKK
jgi:hypothetical protein